MDTMRRNSLVFHSLDKITSLFLHWYPACVAWTERWHPDVVRACSGSCACACMQRHGSPAVLYRPLVVEQYLT